MPHDPSHTTIVDVKLTLQLDAQHYPESVSDDAADALAEAIETAVDAVLGVRSSLVTDFKELRRTRSMPEPTERYVESNHGRCPFCGHPTVQLDGRGPAFIPEHACSRFAEQPPDLNGRRCPSCEARGGKGRVHSDMADGWICGICGDEWHPDHFATTEQPPDEREPNAGDEHRYAIVDTDGREVAEADSYAAAIVARDTLCAEGEEQVPLRIIDRVWQ